MKRNVLVVTLLLFVAVAVASLIIGIVLHPEGMGRGRGGSGFAGVSIYTNVIPIVAIVGILAIFVYYTTLPEMPYTQTERDAVSKGSKESDKEDSPSMPLDVALRFLEVDERRICEVLKEAGGSLLQKEITWKTGYSKVKTHRIVYRLAKRGVVEVEKYFNTNKISLKNQLPEKKPSNPKIEDSGQ